MQISSVAWSLMRPSSLVLLLLVMGVIQVLRGKTGLLSRLPLLLATLVLIAATLLPVGQWMMASLEDRYPRERSYPDHVDGIIGLGGAVVPSLTEHWHTPALTDGAERMTAFVALARRYPEARLLFSGGAGEHAPGRLVEADVARDLFTQLGLDPDRILFERESLDTAENARFSRNLAQPHPGETWLLVTSAFHMPRAAAAFAKVGWPVIPWPVGFKSGRTRGIGTGLNLPQELHLLDYACHEWVGMLVYALENRI